MLFLCSYTRLSKLLVTPIYNVPFRLLAKIYFCWFNRPRLNQNVLVPATSLEPAQSQVEGKSPIEVEDESGFPLKACGNDKPYIFMFLICVICTVVSKLL